MTAPATATEFLEIVRRSGLIDETVFREHFPRDDDLPQEPSACATALIQARLLTSFQARNLLAGKFRGLCLGPYKILNQIGQGGMGTVYLAEHTELDRLVALKMLPPDKAKDKLAIERFKREARAVAALDHPNIVKVFDVFHSGGLYFMAMEYVAGKDLRSLVKETGSLHYATAITYILQAAAGLQHAHEKGFVHRDIKPDNLILSKEGTVKLLDMGLARSFEARDQLTAQLDHGGVVGTAEFISPEQALGEETQDHRSDIYSLGATLYSLIAGSPPFKGHTTQLLMQHQFADPPRLSKKLKSTVPDGLNEVIATMMAKKPVDRFQSAEDVIEALSPFVSSDIRDDSETSSNIRKGSVTKVESRTRMRPPSTPTAQADSNKRRLMMAAAGVLLVAVLGIGGWLMLSGSDSKPRGPQQPNALGPTPGGPGPVVPAAPDIQVKMGNYEATIGSDGTMPSFKVNGAEFLNPKVSISRGLYPWQNWKVLKFENVQRTGNVVTAKGEAGTIRYTFAANKLEIAVTNASRENLVIFIVFDGTDTAMCDGQGQWNKLPCEIVKSTTPEARWAKTEWYSGKGKVTLTGVAAVWGPWEEYCEVGELSIPPSATKTIVFEAGTPTEAEAAKAAAVIGKTIGQGLRLESPMDYQVFQRRTRSAGAVVVRGRAEANIGRLEARVTGMGPNGALPDRWEAVSIDPTSRLFSTELPVPAGGWYVVDVRASEGDKVVAEGKVNHVGVGEVFVIAGQSNSTNCGGDEKLIPSSGMVSTFGGQGWRIANDPQPGVHDGSSGGSPWPAFGDALYAKLRVPIGIASTGHAGSSVNQWRTDGDLFRWTTQRMKQLGRQGFRAVLWHQGEADVSMSSDDYARSLTELIQASRRSAEWEAPWFVARVSYHNPTSPSFPSVRAGQKKVWDAGTALEGPDTDELTGDNRDNGGKGIHFSGKGLRAHGRAWAEKVGAYIDAKLPESN